MMEVLERRGELVGVVEAIAHKSPHNYRFYSGIVGKVRGRLLRCSLYQKARRAGLPATIYHSSRMAELKEFLEQTKPDVCVVASFPCLIPEPLLTLAPLGFINVHMSLLPEFRGPCAALWECVTGSEKAGVTIHQLDAGEDTGDILNQETFQVERGMHSELFYARHLEIAGRLLGQTLDELRTGNVQRRAQNGLPCSVRARRIAPGEELIDWVNWPIDRAYHLLRTGSLWYCYPRLKRGWHALFNWSPLQYESCRHNKPPGSIGWDRGGHYIAHAEGKIRLRRRFSLRKLLGPIVSKILGIKRKQSAKTADPKLGHCPHPLA
jgi:methionyl-tRNA formyltransferase